MPTLKPTPGNVFLEPIFDELKSDLIAFPERNPEEMPRLGKVVAMAGWRKAKNGQSIPPEFKVGDTVFFPRSTGLFVEFNGQKLVQIKYHDVIAVMG